jgi:methylenetetrahydrofolate reductase (NADPH)
MTIRNILDTKKLSVSFEIFPPKKDSSFDSVLSTAVELASLNPDFMSITYGAGGTTRSNTVEIATRLQKDAGITALAHLTCIGSDRSDITSVMRSLAAGGIRNILALRGDFPAGTDATSLPADFAHASDLVYALKSCRDADFCIGGACYPEGHPESRNRDDDIENLRYKVDAGCEFLTTQMFFDNDMLYSFLYRMQAKGIHVPVFAGIMPVMNVAQIKRIVSLSNAYMPRKLLMILDRFSDSPEAIRQAGIAYATDQIIDLISNGIRGIHLYTMNRSDIAREIIANINSIVSAVNGRSSAVGSVSDGGQ